MDRKTAIRLGRPIYATGKPCKYGHVVYRYAKSGTCSTCVKLARGFQPSVTFKGHPADIETMRAMWVILQAQRLAAPGAGGFVPTETGIAK